MVTYSVDMLTTVLACPCVFTCATCMVFVMICMISCFEGTTCDKLCMPGSKDTEMLRFKEF